MRIPWTKAAVYTSLAAGLVLAPALAASDLRSLAGVVIDKGGNALPGAVVQIENTRTLQVRSWITDDAGHYRFNELFDDVDYTVRAPLSADLVPIENVEQVQFEGKAAADARGAGRLMR